jgi:hypothetical protein
MRLKVQVIIESESGEAEVVQEVAKLERHSLRPESLGLTLSEAKALLQEVQHAMVKHQSTEYVTQHIACPESGRSRAQKGKHQIVFRTPFDKVQLDSPRLYQCGCCRKEAPRSFSPLAALLPERTAPELAYLEAKFAALISYGLTAEFLAEVLPIGGDINVAGVYRTVQRVAERLEVELGDKQGHFFEGCQRDWDALPLPGPPITVGLDGGFVHAKGQKSRGEGWFEIIAGKSVPEEGAAKCFAYVQTYDPKPKRRLFETAEIAGPAGQPAGDLLVRRRGGCAGVAALSELGVRTLAGLVSPHDAVDGDGAIGQGVGKRADRMEAGSSMPSRWLRMNRPGPRSSTTGPKTRSQSARSNGFNFNGCLRGRCCANWIGPFFKAMRLKAARNPRLRRARLLRLSAPMKALKKGAKLAL